MLETSQFEADEFLRLLTDALRAGPASPQWHEAIARLRAGGIQDADEHRLLMTARERLESGREFRSIRAGPGFTRKVLHAVELEADRKPGLPLASIVALVAGAALLIVVVILGFLLSRTPQKRASAEELASLYFGTTLISSEFSGTIGPEWRTFGLAPVISARAKGLRGSRGTGNGRDYQSGGIVTVSPMPAAQSFALEANVRMERPTHQVDLRIFLSDRPTLQSDASGTWEFAVDLINGQISVFMPDGKSAPETIRVDQEQGWAHIVIKVNREFAIVEVDGRQLYAGAHALSPHADRWAGVRFLTRGPEPAMEDVIVQSLRILKP